VLHAGHFELAPKYQAENYIQHNPNVPTGRAGFIDERAVRLDHPVPDLFGTHGHLALQTHLDQSALELAHPEAPIQEDGAIKTQNG